MCHFVPTHWTKGYNPGWTINLISHRLTLPTNGRWPQSSLHDPRCLNKGIPFTYILWFKDVADHFVLLLALLGAGGGFDAVLGGGAGHAAPRHQHHDVADVGDVGDGAQRVVHHGFLHTARTNTAVLHACCSPANTAAALSLAACCWRKTKATEAPPMGPDRVFPPVEGKQSSCPRHWLQWKCCLSKCSMVTAVKQEWRAMLLLYIYFYAVGKFCYSYTCFAVVRTNCT